MDSNFAGILGVIFFILTGILGLAHQQGMALVCLAVAFYFFWNSSKVNKT
jgi:hypothetical protein